MAIKLAVNSIIANGPVRTIVYDVWWTGTYTNNPGGDVIDFTQATNPKNLPHPVPNRVPDSFFANDGDMAGAYIGIVKGTTISNWAVKFYGANGTQLATSAAYPAGTPATQAASNFQIGITGYMGRM